MEKGVPRIIFKSGVIFSWTILLCFFFTKTYAQQQVEPGDTTFSQNLSMDPDQDMHPGDEFDINFEMIGFPEGTIYTALMHEGDVEIPIGHTTTGSPIHAEIPEDVVPGGYGIKVVAAEGLPIRPDHKVIRDSLDYDHTKWMNVSGNESGLLTFNGTQPRVATFKPVDLSHGGYVQSDFEWLNSSRIDDNDVYLQYSVDEGESWNNFDTLITSLDYSAYVKSTLPPEAATDHTMIRYIQPDFEAGQDDWEVDLVLVVETGNVIMPNYYENIFFTIHGPQITVGDVDRSLCAGQTLNVPYEVVGEVSNNNVFVVELSDNMGKFEDPLEVGSAAGTSDGTIDVEIPDDAEAGVRYRVRVLAKSGDEVTGSSRPSEEMEVGPVTNASLDVNGNMLTAPEGEDYTWFVNNEELPSASGQTIEATQDGLYSAHVVTAGGCSYRTAAVDPDAVQGVFDKTAGYANLYPNPTTGIVNVNLSGSVNKNVSVEVINASGKTVLRNIASASADLISLDLRDEESGLYFVIISKDGKTVTQQIMKQ